MPEENVHWREQKCGCRYRVEIVHVNRYFDKTETDVQYCDDCWRRFTYLDYLCSPPRKRRRMMKNFDKEMREYVRQREERLVS